MAAAINSGKGKNHWPAGTKYWEDNSPTTKLIREEAIKNATPETLAFLGDLVSNYNGPLIEAGVRKNGHTILSGKKQQDRRSSHLGGSDLAAVFGCSRFTSRLELYYQKIGKQPRFTDVDPMKEVILSYGHACEDVCAQAWQIRYPEWVIKSDETIYNHPKYPFLSANLDRIIQGEDGCWMVGEIKCPVVSEVEKMWWDDNEALLDYQKKIVPEEYELQVRLYMAILGIWQARFAVMLSPTKILYRRVLRDLNKEAALLKTCIDFWENHVLAGIPPEANKDEKDALLALDAVNRYAAPPVAKKTIRLPQKYQNTAVKIMALSSEKSELAKKEEELKKQMAALQCELAQEMADSVEGYIDCPDGATIKITFKPQKGRRSADWERLKEDYPDAYAHCVNEPAEGARPMRIKYM